MVVILEPGGAAFVFWQRAAVDYRFRGIELCADGQRNGFERRLDFAADLRQLLV